MRENQVIVPFDRSMSECSNQSSKECDILLPPTLEFSIDRGGTFTDIYCQVERAAATCSSSREEIVLKLLSEDPKYGDGPREGIRRIIESVCGVPIPIGTPIPSNNIREIRMGTTVATNALLERKGVRTALIVTAGFKDLLRIGNQSRPNIFDLSAKRADVLHSHVLEVHERVRLVSPDEVKQ